MVGDRQDFPRLKAAAHSRADPLHLAGHQDTPSDPAVIPADQDRQRRRLHFLIDLTHDGEVGKEAPPCFLLYRRHGVDAAGSGRHRSSRAIRKHEKLVSVATG